MSAESSLYTALTGAAAVTAIVGAGSAARIYPDVIPAQKSPPAIAYTRIATAPVMTIHGAAPLGDTATLEVACIAATRTAADDLADKAATALAGGGFVYLDRRGELDLENNLWATVLTVDFNT